MAKRTRLTTRGIRLRAIFLPLVAFLVILAINIIALRTRLLPEQASVWMFLFLASVLLIAWSLWWKAKEIGGRPWRTVILCVVSSFAWFFLGQFIPEIPREPTYQAGDRGMRSEGGFTMSASREFKQGQLDRLYARAQHINESGALSDFSCHDSIPVPTLQFHLSLEPEGEYNERNVHVAFRPGLSNAGDQRCMDFGLSWLMESAMKDIDKGPPVDYGYVRSTGERVPPYVAGSLQKPRCLCDLRASGREWVAWTDAGERHTREDAARAR
ncbi:MAG: hypothetical protein JWO05_1540 [Gemmatimonadetes bacterium]|nr:hypothetical protein [Gemmatimonadota bacterium]